VFTFRTHRTKVCLVSGIVQGSDIEPIMFIIFINELVDSLAAHGIRVKFCADDSKMYAEIIDDFDVVRLQAALDTLTQWAEKWQLLISIDKCVEYW